MITVYDLPRSVKYMVQHYNVWIAGSAADPASNIDKVKDLDIIIPFEEWNQITGLIPKDAKMNSYGGWRYTEDNILIDVWPDNLNNFMSSSFPKHIWQPRYNIRYLKVKIIVDIQK